MTEPATVVPGVTVIRGSVEAPDHVAGDVVDHDADSQRA